MRLRSERRRYPSRAPSRWGSNDPRLRIVCRTVSCTTSAVSTELRAQRGIRPCAHLCSDGRYRWNSRSSAWLSPARARLSSSSDGGLETGGLVIAGPTMEYTPGAYCHEGQHGGKVRPPQHV